MAHDALGPRRAHRNRAASRLRWLTGDINWGLMTVALVAGALFALLTVLVLAHPAPFFFDRPIEVAVQSVSVGPFSWFNTFISAFSGFVGIGVGAAAIALTFLFRRPATPLVAFSAVYAAVYNIVNIIVRRPRPSGVAHTVSKALGYGFPSGHVGFFVWLSVLAVIFLARDRLPRAAYIVCWLLAGLFVAAAALSRIYVGAHWPSDVVGGFLVGIAWICLSFSLGRLTGPALSRPRPRAVS